MADRESKGNGRWAMQGPDIASGMELAERYGDYRTEDRLLGYRGRETSKSSKSGRSTAKKKRGRTKQR